MPKNTYYAAIQSINKANKYVAMKEAIKRICSYNKGRYVYRRVTLTLRSEGFKVNHKVGKIRLKKYKSYKGKDGKTAPNILQRNFKADEPNKKWSTDITEFSLFGSKLCLSPIIDLYNGEIINYKVSEHPVLKKVMDIVKKAVMRIEKTDSLILYSDQG